MGPGTGVGDVEVVAACFGWEFGVGVFGDEGAELGGAAFEFATFVVGSYPVGYFVCCLCGISTYGLLRLSGRASGSAPHLPSLLCWRSLLLVGVFV